MAYVLAALVPYTAPNMKLAFSPKQFFSELESISRYKRATLQKALWEAQRRGLIDRTQQTITITSKGNRYLEPYVAERLGKDARLMVIFDVPEERAFARRQLRAMLRAWHFEQVQRSVWISRYDHRQALKELIDELKIKDCVKVYEVLET